MADEGKPATTPGTPGAAGGTSGGTRKIAGKYNSMEEAVESLATGNEKFYHETREEMGAIRQLLERAMTPIGTPGDSRDQGYARGRQQADDDDELDPTEFLARPGSVLKKRDARNRQAIVDELSARNSTMINNAAVVLRFQMKNPDLDEHENLVQGFLQNDTNPRDSLTKRLNDAAKKTRAYLAKIKGKADDDDDEERTAGRNPDRDEYVEGAARAGQGNGTAPAAGEGDDSEDDSLANYLQERNAWKSKRFQAPPRERS